MMFSDTHSRFLAAALIATSLAISGCNARAIASNAAAPPPAPEVSVITVNGEDTPIYNEYTAQTFARDMVEVRGRVDGYIEKRLFETGSDVKAGQPLYILDLRPYEADVQKYAATFHRVKRIRNSQPNRSGCYRRKRIWRRPRRICSRRRMTSIDSGR